ncbi:hypothetical protein GY45DRAFT_1100462 [Cubamyces sp. BRFM 1775]|nr:hypothetical protein GY45DRAFT_1100462 [Cubamyces sp. BRFM 1775]
MPARKRERGDISQRRATTSHAARRIISQFGTKDPQTDYLPKKSGAEMRAPQPTAESVIARNDAWVSTYLYSVRKRGSRAAQASKVLARSGFRKPGSPPVQHQQDQPVDVQAINSANINPHLRAHVEGDRAGQVCESGAGSATDGQSPDKSTTGIRRLERRVVDLNQGVLSEIEEVKLRLLSMQDAMSAIAQRQQPSLPLPTSGTGTPSCIQTPPPIRDGYLGNFTQAEDAMPDNNFPSGLSFSETTSITIPFTSNANVAGYTDDASPSPVANPTCSHSSQRVPSSLSSAIAPEHLMYFDLNGEQIAFDRTSVPNPPSISFAEDISALFKEWHQSELLTVSGRGIPIKYWPWFYQKRTHIKNHAWDVIRSKWNKWKHLVEERDRFPSDDAFWARYSDAEGKHFNQQTILAHLQKAREEENNRDAAAALKFFDNDLNHPLAHGYFVYKKGNVFSLCSKPEAIARKWRELLNHHPEVANAWRHSLTTDSEQDNLIREPRTHPPNFTDHAPHAVDTSSVPSGSRAYGTHGVPLTSGALHVSGASAEMSAPHGWGASEAPSVDAFSMLGTSYTSDMFSMFDMPGFL